VHYNSGSRPIRGPVGFGAGSFPPSCSLPQVTIMPRLILFGVIIGLLLCPMMSTTKGAEPFEVPPEERKVAAQAETDAKPDEPREVRPEELEGFDQISVRSGVTDVIRRAKIELDIRKRFEAVLKDANELDRQGRHEEAAKLRLRTFEGLKRGEPKQETHLPQFKAETEKIKHLRAAAEHLEAADMHELADSLTRQADTLAQYLKEAREILEFALKAEEEKKIRTLEISPSEIKALREAQRKKLMEQLLESVQRQQEAK